MANYFLPSGEKFEYGMKEKSISTVKVLKTYALEIGIPEKDWDAGVNKAVDKHYGSIKLKLTTKLKQKELKKSFKLFINKENEKRKMKKIIIASTKALRKSFAYPEKTNGAESSIN